MPWWLAKEVPCFQGKHAEAKLSQPPDPDTSQSVSTVKDCSHGSCLRKIDREKVWTVERL